MAEAQADAPYAGYDVLRKWRSPSFDDPTRAVLQRRLHAPPARRFFSEAEFALLACACARLLATPVDEPPVARWIDGDLAANRGEGFRAPGAPQAGVAWRHGLAGLEAQAQRQHGHSFVALDGAQQDATLRAVQRGEAQASDFHGIDPAHFFTHLLLKAAASHFYAQPQAWNEIGFGGPASPRGYVRMGVGQRDPWEAPLPPSATEAR